jgi:drug/metabolite transporter (DMT)-like permease
MTRMTIANLHAQHCYQPQSTQESLPLSLSPNLRGALFMAISMAGFTINDTFVKMATQEMNVAQIMFVRGLMATAMIAALSWHMGALRPVSFIWKPGVLARSVGEMAATVTFLAGLAHMPIGNASAILQALPLAVTLGAVLFLGEKVGWRRWAAIFVGFLGVLIIVRPGMEGFSQYSLLILACVFAAAFRDLATRRAPADVPSLFMTLVTASMISLTGLALIAPFGGWTPMSARSLFILFAAAGFIIFGYLFIINAMRAGDIGFIAPFRYTSLIWALGLGFLVFGDIPDQATILGAALVIGSGTYSFYRERVRARHIQSAVAPEPAA